MPSLLSSLFTPAIVSLIVSLWVGRTLEARRARRDHITKLFEQCREDVRRGTEAAADYFSTTPVSRTPLQEAKVLSADREIRAAIPLLLDEVPLAGCGPLVDAGNEALVAYIQDLTGGNFQEKDGEVSKEHLLRLVHAGAGLRTALARLRDAQLRILAEEDAVQRWTRAAGIWAVENNPFRNERR